MTTSTKAYGSALAAADYEVLNRYAAGNLSVCRGGAAGQRFVIRLLHFDPPASKHDGSGAAISQEHAVDLALPAVATLRALSHPHLPKVEDIVRQAAHLSLILSPVPSSWLMKRVFESIARRLTMTDARKYFRQLVSALLYAHERGVAHGNITPYDLLLADAETAVLFGVGMLDLPAPLDPHAGVQTTKGRLSVADADFIGAYDFRPPEVKASRGPPSDVAGRKRADVWALGAILHAMMHGTEGQVASASTTALALSPSTTGVVDATGMGSRSASPGLDARPAAKDSANGLIALMMHPDPQQRATLGTVVEHPWFSGVDMATSRRMSQKLLDASATAVPSYLGEAEGIPQEMFTERVQQYLAGPPEKLARRFDLSFRFFGTVADVLKALENSLGCHLFGDKEVVAECRIPHSAHTDTFTTEAMKIEADGSLVHFAVVCKPTDVGLATNHLDSISSLKSMWQLHLAPRRGSEAVLNGLLFQLRRSLGGAVAADGSQ